MKKYQKIVECNKELQAFFQNSSYDSSMFIEDALTYIKAVDQSDCCV